MGCRALRVQRGRPQEERCRLTGTGGESRGRGGDQGWRRRQVGRAGSAVDGKVSA